MRNLGRERVNALRLRLSQLRRDADTALARTEQLEAHVEALRRELAATTIAVGDQLAALSAVLERLERELTAAPTTSPSDPDRR